MQAPVRGFIADVPQASTTSPAPHFDPFDLWRLFFLHEASKPDVSHPATSITTQLVITTVYTITLLLITRYSIDPAITYFRSSV
ncbi:hypothetical protein D0863_10809 [Hortaea werneckii]|uniref:Uncharacterized protein n=1 Tax=Hortaea werneckii TaxID=91943 RepID=A0A3M7DFP3_HORWE|nr:hypothetical protein D0863_10809 [Hortaea werneckii]